MGSKVFRKINRGIRKIKNRIRDHINLDTYKDYYDLRNIPILDRRTPDIFNKDGERMHLCYMQDIHSASTPYGGFSQHILWDRNNYALDVHFYTHEQMLRTTGKPVHRYGYLYESESIVPHDYTLFSRHSGLHKDFDLIFTHSEQLLDSLPNARFAPASMLWYGLPLWQGHTQGGGVFDPIRYTKKTKDVSMVSSNKSMCPLHMQRKDVARYCQQNYPQQVDVLGGIDGGIVFADISESLDPYRYSIVFENFVCPRYFTEKILNCFAAMTIPIYLGATKISEYFNTDGIIQLSSASTEEIDRVLSACSPEDYQSRIEAIIDNYNRVFEFRCAEDYIYEHYLKDILSKTETKP